MYVRDLPCGVAVISIWRHAWLQCWFWWCRWWRGASVVALQCASATIVCWRRAASGRDWTRCRSCWTRRWERYDWVTTELPACASQSASTPNWDYWIYRTIRCIRWGWCTSSRCSRLNGSTSAPIWYRRWRCSRSAACTTWPSWTWAATGWPRWRRASSRRWTR